MRGDRHDDPGYVYRAYDEGGRLLYVGSALNPDARFQAHGRDSAWFGDIAAVTLERYPDIFTARAAEREAIKSEWPLWNIAHSPDGDIVQLIARKAVLAQMDATPIWRLRGAARRSAQMRLGREFERHRHHANYVRRMVGSAQLAADDPEAAAHAAQQWERGGFRDFPGSPEDVFSAKAQALFRLYEVEKAEEERAARDA